MQHEWRSSALNHGSAQCIHCHCTREEAMFALGMECSARKPPRPVFMSLAMVLTGSPHRAEPLTYLTIRVGSLANIC